MGAVIAGGSSSRTHPFGERVMGSGKNGKWAYLRPSSDSPGKCHPCPGDTHANARSRVIRNSPNLGKAAGPPQLPVTTCPPPIIQTTGQDEPGNPRLSSSRGFCRW